MKTAGIERPDPTVHATNGCRLESCESAAGRKIGQSIIYMLRHLDQPLQVATLASRANVSSSHFFALFKREVGRAPIDYFIRLRMQRACRLLDETGMSVKEIAATLGYGDPFYFSRIFKSVHQVAPSGYRSLKNGAKEAARNGGINLRFFQPHESRTDLESAGSHPGQDPGGLLNRADTSPVGATGDTNWKSSNAGFRI